MSRARILPLAALLAIPFCPAAGRAATVSRIVFAADRAPSVTGEIYRLDPNGHRVDLSHSPYQDTNPVVSSNGKQVAFVSNRSGKEGVYEVGINGHRLVRIGPSYSPGGDSTLAWQPGGSRIALVGRIQGRRLPMGFWLLQRGHSPIRLLSTTHAVAGPWWSPDGRVVAVTAGDTVRAFSAAGHPLWQASGACCGTWSAHDLLALGLGNSRGLVVYDARGHRLFGAVGEISAGPSWSPDGSLVAAIVGGKLEVLTAQGGLLLQKPLPGPRFGMAWADAGHVVVGGFGKCGCHARSIDVATGQTSAASSRWLDPLSPDGTLAIVTTQKKPGFRLGIARPGGGHVTAYARIAACRGYGVWTPAASSLQFVGRSRSLVYQSWGDCDEPFANLYSVASDGTGVQRLTDVQAQETQPAVSPDGSEIAYVWAQYTGLSCAGCSDGIRIASAGGTAVRTLTNPQNCNFDDSPTWSPDGSTILFSESSCDTFGELFTVPAGGGTPHDLGIAGREPAWGPSRIAYVGSDQSNHGLWTANPDGTDPVRIGQGSHPAWSTDGRLAYLVGTTLVVGSTSVALPFTQVTSLAWSPDGTRLVVTAKAKANSPADDLYTISTSGTDRVRLTKNFGAVGPRP